MPTGTGQSGQPDIEEEAARAEIDRLNSARGVGLGIQIMKAWGRDGPGRAMSQREIAEWLLRDYPSCLQLIPLLRSSVRVSSELLVEEGLLEEANSVYSVSAGGEVGGRADQLATTKTGAEILAAGGLDRWAVQYAREFLAETDGPDGCSPSNDEPPDSEDHTEAMRLLSEGAIGPNPPWQADGDLPVPWPEFISRLGKYRPGDEPGR